MDLLQSKINSPVGDLYLTASKKGLQGIHWKKQPIQMAKSSKESRILAQAEKELAEYFKGRRKDFRVPLDMAGTPFQKSVWKQLQRIPYGKTCSYGDVAKKIKNAKAMRAVGSANGKNPVCIIVPCHRVIAADGSIGGYAGGLQMKRILLGLEGKKDFAE